MILIVGLGNPGPRYALTRHNFGFMALDAFADESGKRVAWKSGFHGSWAKFSLNGEELVLLKPETFMNDSGRSVRAASSAHRVPPADVLVLHDELDIAAFELRLKFGGGDGGHRGLRSISAELGSVEYGRLRLGIGRPPPDFSGSVADFVLDAVPLSERAELTRALGRASEVVKSVVVDGFAPTMNRTNQRTVR